MPTREQQIVTAEQRIQALKDKKHRLACRYAIGQLTWHQFRYLTDLTQTLLFHATASRNSIT